MQSFSHEDYGNVTDRVLEMMGELEQEDLSEIERLKRELGIE